MTADDSLPAWQRSWAFRFWPHLSGLLLSGFFALAEKESWHQSLDRPYADSVWTWWSTRFPAPIAHLAHEPGVAIAVLLVLVPMVLAHVIKPEWYIAPLSIIGVFGWCVWGSMALGRVAALG